MDRDEEQERAALEAHSRAISTAVLEANWQLAAKLLALMLARGLRPNEGTFYRVLALCARCARAVRLLVAVVQFDVIELWSLIDFVNID